MKAIGLLLCWAAECCNSLCVWLSIRNAFYTYQMDSSDDGSVFENVNAPARTPRPPLCRHLRRGAGIRHGEAASRDNDAPENIVQVAPLVQLGQVRGNNGFYLALAQELAAPFHTGDKRLANRARQLGIDWVIWVGEGWVHSKGSSPGASMSVCVSINASMHKRIAPLNAVIFSSSGWLWSALARITAWLAIGDDCLDALKIADGKIGGKPKKRLADFRLLYGRSDPVRRHRNSCRTPNRCA
jgi:hypothetical protein